MTILIVHVHAYQARARARHWVLAYIGVTCVCKEPPSRH